MFNPVKLTDPAGHPCYIDASKLVAVTEDATNNVTVLVTEEGHTFHVQETVVETMEKILDAMDGDDDA